MVKTPWRMENEFYMRIELLYVIVKNGKEWKVMCDITMWKAHFERSEVSHVKQNFEHPQNLIISEPGCCAPGRWQMLQVILYQRESCYHWTARDAVATYVCLTIESTVCLPETGHQTKASGRGSDAASSSKQEIQQEIYIDRSHLLRMRGLRRRMRTFRNLNRVGRWLTGVQAACSIFSNYRPSLGYVKVG